jgi:hypothetical protein
VRPDHLFLGTGLDNQRDSIQKGRREHMRGEGHPMARLTVESVRAMRALHRAGGRSYASLARQYGVSEATATCAIKGTLWRHVTD